MNKVIVVGAGPAGIMAAIEAKKWSKEVILIEKNNQLGKKLLLTGGGRCNLTNNCETEDFFEKLPRNSRFMYSSIYSFDKNALMNFFEERGVLLKQEGLGKIYPFNKNSNDILQVLLKELESSGVKIILNAVLEDLIIKENKVVGIKLDKNQIFADKVILALGGKSYQSTGSDGKFFSKLKALGHNIIDLVPALTPISVNDSVFRNSQGISLKNIEIIAKKNNKKIKSQFGDIVFTHFGISGPCVMNLSSFINRIEKKNLKIYLDFIPDKSKEEILKILEEEKQKSIANTLRIILPSQLIKNILLEKKLPEFFKKFTKLDKNNLIELLKNYEISNFDLKGFSHSIVTSGGVDVKDVSPYTMESLKIKNLYFAGEMLDLEGITGGFNLQIAFSTGFLAGQGE